MVRRQAAPQLQVPLGITPQGGVTDQFVAPARNLDVLRSFSGLSDTISKFLQEKAEKDAARAIEQGAAAAIADPVRAGKLTSITQNIQDPEEATAALRREFKRLEDTGEIPKGSNPFTQVGFLEASARQLMSKYRANVSARLQETAVSRDSEGNTVEPQTPEQIMSEEYAKLAGDASLRNSYGQAAAAAVKERYDQQFAAEAAELSLESQKQLHRQDLTTELAERFDAVAMGSKEGPADLLGISEFVTTSVAEKLVEDPRGLVMDSLRVSVARARRVNPEQALQLLQNAEHLRVGGVTLGDDPRTALDLDVMRQQLEEQTERQVGRDNRARAEAETKVVGDYRGGWITRFEAAQRAGEDLGAIYQEEIDRVEREVGDPALRGIAIQELKNTVETVEGTDISTPGAADAVQRRIGQGDVEGARALYDSQIADPAVRYTTKDLFSLRQALDGAEALDPWIEKNPVRNDALGRILELEDEFSQFGGEADSDWRRMVRDERDAFNLQMEQLAGLPDSPGKSKAIRDGVNAWMTEFGKRTDEERTRRFEGRTDFYDKLESLNKHKQDAREFAARARDRGVISFQEYRQAVDSNDQAADRTPLLRSAAVQSAKDNIYRSIFDGANPMVSSERVADAWGALDSKVHAWADANLSKTDPREIDRALAAAVPDLVDEVLGTTPEAAKAEEKTEAGGTAEEAAEAANVEQARVGEARGLFDAVTSPKKMRGDDPLLRRSELVPRSTYDAYARFAQKTGDVSKDDVTSLFARQSFEVLDDASLTPQQREEAVVSMYRLTGIPAEQVLAGKLIVELPRDSKAYRDGAARLKVLETVSSLAGQERRYELPRKGLVEPGNIDLADRPEVDAPEGGKATVRSMSFEQDGVEILVPTVSPAGRILSDEEAIQEYRRTGKHLGKFKNPDAATRYADALHDAYESGKIQLSTRGPQSSRSRRLNEARGFWRKALERSDEVPLTDLSAVNPYSTPFWTSKQEIESWKRNRPDELNALREKLGIADDPQAVKFWLDSQVEAMIINARELQ